MGNLETHRDRREEGVKVAQANPNSLEGKIPVTVYMGEAKTIIYVEKEKYNRLGKQYFIDKYATTRRINVLVR